MFYHILVLLHFVSFLLAWARGYKVKNGISRELTSIQGIKKMKFIQLNPAKSLVALSVTALLTACGGNDNDFDNVQQVEPIPPVGEPTPTPIPSFAANGELEAEIRWTTYGVPHVKADSLESMAYGVV